MRRIFLLAASLIVVSTIAIVALFSGDPQMLGGMSSRYRAVDFDPQLTRVALEAAPIVAAINSFVEQRGECPPANAEELTLLDDLRRGFRIAIQGDQVFFRKLDSQVDWIYSSTSLPQMRCVLWRKLGWDPSLSWWRYGDHSEWIFDPGDGSKTVAIELNTF